MNWSLSLVRHSVGCQASTNCSFARRAPTVSSKSTPVESIEAQFVKLATAGTPFARRYVTDRVSGVCARNGSAIARSVSVRRASDFTASLIHDALERRSVARSRQICQGESKIVENDEKNCLDGIAKKWFA
jgi:hypothetical protein